MWKWNVRTLSLQYQSNCSFQEFREYMFMLKLWFLFQDSQSDRERDEWKHWWNNQDDYFKEFHKGRNEPKGTYEFVPDSAVGESYVVQR